MDILIVVGDDPPPERLAARARHLVRSASEHPGPELIAQVRMRFPRDVGVVGPPHLARTLAVGLYAAGFPTTLYIDTTCPVDRRLNVVPITDPGPKMDVADSLLQMVGNTPLVRLDRVGRDLSCHLVAKLEQLNPGGSIGDRPALAMVEAAERAGLLARGGTIIESTSGNTGVGLAIVAARRGYRCVFAVPDKASGEKVALLRAYGAEVVICPSGVPAEHPDSYHSVAARRVHEIAGAFQPDQYRNPENPLTHERTTGPEIWRQTAGRVTHVVAGIGTGGTITGVSRALKALNPSIQVVGADPEGSVYSGGAGRPNLVEGMGEAFWPETYDPAAVDRVVVVSDRDSFLMARHVTRQEGILVGGSAGSAVWAALHVGRELTVDDVVVVILPDSGTRYLSKLYNEDWMADLGFIRVFGQTIGDVLSRKNDHLPPLVHVHPHETVRTAIGILREFDVSQAPVVNAELPLAAADVMGVVHERDLMDRVFYNSHVLDQPVVQLMSHALPTVGAGELIEAAVEELQMAAAVLVVDGGHPIGILTRSDVLGFLAQGASVNVTN